jgi:hypothetical protein
MYAPPRLLLNSDVQLGRDQSDEITTSSSPKLLAPQLRISTTSRHLCHFISIKSTNDGISPNGSVLHHSRQARRYTSRRNQEYRQQQVPLSTLSCPSSLLQIFGLTYPTVRTYFAHPPNTPSPEHAIIIMTDVFGMTFPNIQLIADQFAVRSPFLFLLLLPHSQLTPLLFTLKAGKRLPNPDPGRFRRRRTALPRPRGLRAARLHRH